MWEDIHSLLKENVKLGKGARLLGGSQRIVRFRSGLGVFSWFSGGFHSTH